MFVTKQYSLAN